MAHMDPGQALARLERALRQVMAYCYTKHYSEDWLQKVATQKQIECWEERARDEASRREKRGVVNTPSAGLEYANLYDLREIIRRHWQPVSPALGARKETDALLSEAVRFLALLDRADALRNTVAHSRELLPFEEDLLAGIAGDIENRVTIYMSSQDPNGDTYPRITSVRDSLGQESGVVSDDRIELRPGAEVTFVCHGHDSRGRQLQWDLLAPRSGVLMAEGTYEDRQFGSDVTLKWKVTDEDVRDDAFVSVMMRTADWKYHRQGWFDEIVTLRYRVVEPG